MRQSFRLKPNTQYKVRMRYASDFKQSVWSTDSDWMETLDSAPSAAPTLLNAAPYESAGIQLTWTPPPK